MMTETEKQELLQMAESEELRTDMRRVRHARKTPFVHNRRIDLDAYIEFLDAFNAFVNHRHKPFKPMIEVNMKL
jgi:hypothetical protein